MTASRWPTRVRRRDGTLVPFDAGRIEAAVLRAAREVACDDPDMPGAVARTVADTLGPGTADVETIQDFVEARLGRPASTMSPAPTSSIAATARTCGRPRRCSGCATSSS